MRAELKAYSAELAKKPEVIAFNKVDALDAKALEKKLKAFKTKVKKTPLAISAAGNLQDQRGDAGIDEDHQQIPRNCIHDGDNGEVTTDEWQP